ncbi:SMI1/KNR4 family protein [Streptomyces gamaensis]|uniref:SMI1/KNR4 family protein n=1 Tax=Streptomyces gamaensis TaxID=1763542 RepID=A0ABW0YXT2_9ACTN
MSTTVDIPRHVQEHCNQLGKGASYALKVLCAQLSNDPLLGTPQDNPSSYTVEIDGDTFEDCPALQVHYAYGPPLLEEDRVEIRSVTATQPPVTGVDDRDQVPDTRLEEIVVRQVTGAWRRIETWLRERAPASFASLQAGASREEIDRTESELGVRVPVELRALWGLHRGVHSSVGAAFLQDNGKLMTITEVVDLHRHWGEVYDDHLWDRRWIPVCTLGEHSWSSGLYLDAGTGEMWSWDEFANRQAEFESLTSYLEETADALEVPSLAGPVRPGLVDGALVWGTYGGPV